MIGRGYLGEGITQSVGSENFRRHEGLGLVVFVSRGPFLGFPASLLGALEDGNGRYLCSRSFFYRLPSTANLNSSSSYYQFIVIIIIINITLH